MHCATMKLVCRQTTTPKSVDVADAAVFNFVLCNNNYQTLKQQPKQMIVLAFNKQTANKTCEPESGKRGFGQGALVSDACQHSRHKRQLLHQFMGTRKCALDSSLLYCSCFAAFASLAGCISLDFSTLAVEQSLRLTKEKTEWLVTPPPATDYQPLLLERPSLFAQCCFLNLPFDLCTNVCCVVVNANINATNVFNNTIFC